MAAAHQIPNYLSETQLTEYENQHWIDPLDRRAIREYFQRRKHLKTSGIFLKTG